MGGDTYLGVELSAGMDMLGLPVRSTSVEGTETCARFRIASFEVALDPSNRWYPQPYERGSPMPNGEAEDYAATVSAVSGPPDHLEIADMAISTAETCEAWTSIFAVRGFHVISPGIAAFRAGSWIRLGDGFAIDADCEFSAVLGAPSGCPRLSPHRGAGPTF